MPRVHKRKARTDRYKIGLRIDTDKTKSGSRLDKSKPCNENDEIFCKKGDTYYTWQMFRSRPSYSLIRPKRQQLTRSAFKCAIYDMEDCVSDFSSECPEDFTELVQNIIEQAETLRDEQEESKQNMPDNLQESPVAEMLQERYDGLDNYINELESLKDNFDEDADDAIEDAIDELSNLCVEY